MLQLIVNLDKNNYISKEEASGKWAIYLEKDGQRDKVEERFFSSYVMESELEKAVDRLNSWIKRID